jgi:hypothetical protein
MDGLTPCGAVCGGGELHSYWIFTYFFLDRGDSDMTPKMTPSSFPHTHQKPLSLPSVESKRGERSFNTRSLLSPGNKLQSFNLFIFMVIGNPTQLIVSVYSTLLARGGQCYFLSKQLENIEIKLWKQHFKTQFIK